jgi:hypothetical protein
MELEQQSHKLLQKNSVIQRPLREHQQSLGVERVLLLEEQAAREGEGEGQA